MGRAAYQRRLERLVERRDLPDEQIRHWTRAWVSQVVRVQSFALRIRHFVVVTDDRVLLVPVRYWTRRPAKRYTLLDTAHIDVTEVGDRELRKLRVDVRGKAPLLLHFGGRRRDRAVARWLLEGPQGEANAPAAPRPFVTPDSDSFHVSGSNAATAPTSTSSALGTVAEAGLEPAGTATDPPDASPTEATQ